MAKILFIVGSIRKDSFNRQLAREVEQIIANRAVVEYLEYNDVPFMNQDAEFPAPEAVERVRTSVSDADAIWIFSPEYNASYPGHLKNLIDWLSRPVVANDYATPTVIAGKKVALSGAGGQSGTGKAREKLSELLTFVGANPMVENQAGVILNTEAWTEGTMILTDEQKSDLAQQVETFLDYMAR